MLRLTTLLLFTSALLVVGAPSSAAGSFAPEHALSSPVSTVPPSTVAPDSLVEDPASEPTVPPTTAAPDSLVEDPAPEPTVPATTAPGAEPSDTTETVVDDDPVTRPSAPPQVRSSDIPLGSILFAALVLSGVGVASSLLARRSSDDASSDAPGPIDGAVHGDGVTDARGRAAQTDAATLDFLLGLGQSLIDAGGATSHVESTLRTVARMNGIDDIGVVALPTALIVSLSDDRNVTTEVSAAGQAPLRLQQIDDVLRLVQEAERGAIGPAEGQQRLQQIRLSAHPYPARLAVFGYACSTVGLAMILRATWREVVVAAVLGAVIGSFRLSTRRLGSSAQPFVPLIASTAVAISVFALARVIDDLVTFPLLVAPLITFLPGAMLTIATLELATGQIVSGASRLASGLMQLVLLALGLVAGRQLVGVPAAAVRQAADGSLAMLAPWVGVAVFGVGVVWFNGARGSSRNWILLVLYVAYSGQVIGGLFFGSALSAFFGALAMTPVALVAARRFSGPTPLVTFLPGFWILVPGALGLDGVTRLLGGGAGSGALVTTVTSMVGVSLGILLGLTLAASDPERPWADAQERTGR